MNVGTACCAAVLVVLGVAVPLHAQAAVVRDVRVIPAAAATHVIVEIDGSFEYRAHGSSDGGTVFIDIADSSIDEDATRMLPVSDRRVDGVIVQEGEGARDVRIAVDVAGRLAPQLETTADGSRLVLTFVDGSTPQSGVPPPASLEGSPASGSARTEPDRAARAAARARIAAMSKGRGGVAASATGPAEAGSATVDEPARGGSAVPRRSVLERPVVVLDPGHGGKDPGAKAWTGEFEKDIVLDLAERVARRLRKSGEVEVVMTRSGDEYVALADRRDFSRRWSADAFVSIHANASGSSAARGIETYYYSRKADDGGDRVVRRLARVENGGKSGKGRVASPQKAALAGGGPVLDRRSESMRLARLVQSELVRRLGMRYEAVRDLGAKEGPFFVLGDNAAPSVLVEAAFLTHREEGLRMRSEVYREQIADGVARGILAFVETQREAGAL